MNTKVRVARAKIVRIKWQVFEGSSHLEESVVEFAQKTLRTYKDWIAYNSPHMKEAIQEIKRIRARRLPLVEARKRAKAWAIKHYGAENWQA